MSIAPTLARYLDQTVTYELLFHNPTMSSSRTAQASHVSGDRFAKAVLLRRDGTFLLAVLPASRQLDLSELRAALGADIDLARESEVDAWFADCEHGAVPPVGECYGLDVMVDESIDRAPEVYFEAGDHTTLVHMTQAQFALLTASARHRRFSLRG